MASQPDLDKEIVEKRWNQLHRKNAKLVHQHILKYRGFLTKFGALDALEVNFSTVEFMNICSGLIADLHRSSSIFIDLLFKYSGAMPGEFAQLCSAGQAASTKAGSLPAPWVEELRDLQDELPISNYQDTP